VFYSLGLTGYPLDHSLSPILHAAALRAAGLEGEYRCYPVPPLPGGEGALAALLSQLRRGELHGLNVTIPHKQAVFPWLDGLSAEAGAIGAVNTIVRQGQRLAGLNTDAAGFQADLKRLGWFDGEVALHAQSEPPHALVLGAGGSARAVAYALAQANWKVSVAARRIQQAEQLAASLQRPAAGATGAAIPARQAITPVRLEPDGLRLEPPPALIANATPVGMAPNSEASPWPANLPLPAGCSVYDLVYNPGETALVRAARKAGRPAANGLGMLIEQAALAFEAWTGREAPREAMRQAVDMPSKPGPAPKRAWLGD
jgi:shikimate dehydrogenase